ncbi:urease accessory protein UreF [Neobacillus sp. LXY-4]|uniref:urease accessory protein UreF n=1 Tax=Neobacillus sp. LXY-4 TaxID=3379826 RepID=UPI003EE315E2
MISSLFSLLQLCDSSFPSGAFSHSFGLETYIQEFEITDKNSFYSVITTYIDKQLVFSDGLACRLAYEALESTSISELLELDELLFVSSLANETRQGNRRIGVRMAKLCYDLYPSENLLTYLTQIDNKQAYGHSAFVFAIVCHHLRVDKETTIGTYLFATVSSLIQNAVRGVPLGQTDGQKLIIECEQHIRNAVEVIKRMSIDDLGAVSPGLEISQMRHERLPVRLFMS